MNTEPAPLFSLVSGEGDGFMLGVAAGDSAGGAWELGYSAVTEQVTVISYLLIEHRRLDGSELVRGLRELDGSEDGEPVYRSETPHFRAWLDRAAAGTPVPEFDATLDNVARTIPLGVVHRHEPDVLMRESIAMGRVFAAEAAGVAAGVISATATAASCFGQSGRDLIAGVKEAVSPALGSIAAEVENADRLRSLPDELDQLMGLVGVSDGDAALALVGGDSEDPIQMMLAGLLLAAPAIERAHIPIEQAARIGGSVLGAAVGGMLGARVGIRAWPWAFANDTWFAEIGRRTVRGPDEVRDLPIPYAVEQHLMTGTRPGFH